MNFLVGVIVAIIFIVLFALFVAILEELFDLDI